MHADEVETDPSLVQRLVAGQFPRWADLPIEPVFPLGTDNANYRLGDDKLVRLPRQSSKVAALERELELLPRLGASLPLATPEPLGRGDPAEGFPFPWAVYTWLEGENVSVGKIRDPQRAAAQLAEVILAVRALDATDAPLGLRRDTLRALDDWVHMGAAKLDARYDSERLLAAWEETLDVPGWDGPPTWCHCDLDLRNIVFLDGRPSAVLDWGGAGLGDPASDGATAWKVLPAEARPVFWKVLGADDTEIARARGWTLMQCAGALSYYTPGNNPALFHEAERWLTELLGSAPRRSGGRRA
jgi:aminoglycoside phosphotransferase (APT) family kinase protein